MSLKRPLRPTFFSVFKQVLETSKGSIADAELLVSLLWRDTLARAPDCDPGSMQAVINNIGKFVDVVYHTDYSLELVTCEFFSPMNLLDWN